MKTIAAALGLALALTCAPGSASACSCAVMEPAGALRVAALVFEGTLVRLEPSPRGEGMRQAVFRVHAVWKGEVTREVSVPIPTPPTMCPPHFEVGQRYIVYADPSDDGPSVRTCARYAAGPGLASERRALGRPIRATPR